MALPAPGTFSSLSAETPCYTYNWNNNVGGGAQTIVYTDCNGNAGITQSPGSTIGTNGTFCARSTNSPGGVSVNQAGNCGCKTWYNRVFNTTAGNTYTFSFIDCNGQPAKKSITTGGGPSPGDVSFRCCSKSKPVVVVVGGSYNLDQSIDAQYCDRGLVG